MGIGREQAQFREHLGEMRRAAAGLGRDFAHEFSDLDRKIERLGTSTARDARELASEFQAELSRLGRSIDAEIRRLPSRIAGAGVALGAGTARAAGAARDAMANAGKRARQGTRNAFAAAAGVRRTPIREWTPPTDDE